jgi:hypothetical protein
MKRFLHNNEDVFLDLKIRMEQACVVLRNADLPPTCSPNQGKIGFENLDSGQIVLLVEFGVQYGGALPLLTSWFQNGRLEFSNFAAIQSFLEVDMAKAFDEGLGIHQSSSPPHSSTPSTLPDPQQITDLSQVATRSSNIRPKCFVSIVPEHLFAELKRSIRGQDDALRFMSEQVANHFAKTAPIRPTCLILVGPPGVGKTETCKGVFKALENLVPDGGIAWKRLDMNEYSESHSAARLIGSPPGYVGHGEPSELDGIQDNPYSIVLFDEIDKAHPDVFSKTLMNAMENGEIVSASGGAGKRIDCRRCFFLFTSNAKETEIIAALEQRNAYASQDRVDAICQRIYNRSGLSRPLIDRIMHFIPFRPLPPTIMAEVTTLGVCAVAAEYDLEIVRIEPSIISEILNSVDESVTSARQVKYRASRMLGSVFAQYVRLGSSGKIRIIDEPNIACLPALENSVLAGDYSNGLSTIKEK